MRHLVIAILQFLWCVVSGNRSQVPEEELGKKTSYFTEVLRLRDHYQNQKCGNWKDRYLQQYRMFLTRPESERKYLVSMPHLSGMADRIIGFTTAFSFAILSNRIFVIARRRPLPNIEDVFISPYINWTRDHYDDDWVLAPLQYKAKVRNYNQTVLQQGQYYAINTLDDWKLQDRFLRQNIADILGTQARQSIIVINRGKTIRLFENQHYSRQLTTDMGLTPSIAFGCFVQFLIKPKPFIFLNMIEQFQEVQQYTTYNISHRVSLPISAPAALINVPSPSNTLIIAIQIRTGDTFIQNDRHAINIDHYSAYFSCAKQIENFVIESNIIDTQTSQLYTDSKWYLVTDSIPLRKAAIEKYGHSKIITNLHSKIEHSSKEASVCDPQKVTNCEVSLSGFATAAAEWWLMSFARYHVITRYSGYGRSAGMLSLYENAIYTIADGKAASHDIVCNNQTFTDLENLSYDWSGI